MENPTPGGQCTVRDSDGECLEAATVDGVFCAYHGADAEPGPIRESGSGGFCNNKQCPDYGQFVPVFRYHHNDLWSCDTCGKQDTTAK